VSLATSSTSPLRGVGVETGCGADRPAPDFSAGDCDGLPFGSRERGQSGRHRGRCARLPAVISSLADLLRTHAAERPDKIALVLEDRTVTWAQLYSRACQVARALAAEGVVSQDRIAFLDRNGIEHFEVLYGAALLNAVVVAVNWRLAPPEVEVIVQDSGADLLIVGPDYVSVLDPLSVKRSIVIGRDYEPWVDAQEPVDPGAVPVGPDVAFQLYSSGTTGRPKGVMLANDNLFQETLLEFFQSHWGVGSDSVNLVAMPLFHIGGTGWAVAGMAVGAVSVVVRDLDPTRLVALIGEQRITHGFLVPAALQFMLAVPGVEQADFTSLDTLVYGASPISDEVLRASLKTFGCRFWQVYGLTETTGGVVHLPPEDHDPDGLHSERLRSCGLPGPGVEVRIIDLVTGADAATGQVGEILVRSQQVMKGYWRNDAATAEAIDTDGWFRSGDVGYLDADGYLFLHDRVKDMIVSGGENVYPAEVENVLMGIAGVADAAVIGVPSERWGETPKAVLVKAPGSALTEAEVLAACRDQLAGFKCPTSVDWAEVLPRNPSGKLLKKDLRAPYWAGYERKVN
jgi:long-chain acyl-CoA synthetase